MVRLALAFLFLVVFTTVEAAAGQAAPYKIVVLAGEDSINVIQQKTAVAPLVEVRDRNNQPVSGVVVTFAVQGGKAAVFQGGASTLTIATNVAGQAAATGLTPLAAGAVNISVEAAVQGQVITAAISQVNVMTAAEAAAAAAGASSGTASTAGGGAAAGGGGGVSATTIGIIGGVAAAGAVAATQVAGGGESGATTYSGPFAIEWTLNFGNCARVERYSGTLEVEIADHESPTSALTGTASGIEGVEDVISNSCPGPIQVGRQGNWGMPDAAVSGTEPSMVFESRDTVPARDGNGNINRVFRFTGSLSGTTITGTVEMTWQGSAGTPTGRSTVTLSRQ